MLQIDYRLNDEDLKEYCAMVEGLIGDDDALEKSNLLCGDFFKFITDNGYHSYDAIQKHIDNLKILGRKYAELDTMLTLEHEQTAEVVEFLDAACIQNELDRMNLEARTLKLTNTPLRSYNDLRKRREQLKSGINQFYPIIRNEIIYDRLHLRFSHFIAAYSAFPGAEINQWIVNKTDTRVCPYCNLTYVYNRKKHSTAQLDHFFSKSEYPMFALGFYNLIPSCPACNRIKSDNNKKLASPYDEDVFSDVRITWYPGKLIGNVHSDWSLTNIEKNIEIAIETVNPRVENNMSSMEIGSAYSNHLDYASEVIAKVRTYMNPEAQELIRKTCSDMGITSDDIERFYFANYTGTKKIKNRPLAKLTNDFIEEYKASISKYEDFF